MDRHALLETNLKQLKLPTFVQNYRPFAEDAVKAHKGYDAFLLALTEQEIAQREANRQRLCIKAARFPLLKELADFDFSCVPALNKQQVTVALLDRLTHRAHILEFAGESFRFRQRLQREARKK